MGRRKETEKTEEGIQKIRQRKDKKGKKQL